ncbi:HD domain-containing protein [Candidatus Thiothrix anitrata]|jgi:(p)ppGpp synthase/HD superfamily hydrolase|uniref:Bifunctional (P)ppGpp synthetase/guanosine-3',5'-bis(Diphosphate) 3'-pyrophosphohydrolase n=1 Tax=Candidatus Thiothrix anitrata TaxID=2823902 RepID=A0ABX7X4B6_9GAMM|nr:HD domain-containing protein [Candidatus Thiothrix anitrata]QTR50724.1 bifunctional (p)ppGpp synthetase/guanosine-3',5'-bis(diphosphate) 3'-pyrophosphohydrolase [Candidatus Thiothrix anitrata]
MLPTWSQDSYLQAWDFACLAHRGQVYAGHAAGVEYDYLNHPAAVTMEVIHALAFHPEYDGNLAVQCALLHDVLEDTQTQYATLLAVFGQAVADGVSALTKDASLPKAIQMSDSLHRICQQPREIWLVKLADRISNLQYVPPHWGAAKAAAYRDEAQVIADTLGAACPSLLQRLQEHIQRYA